MFNEAAFHMFNEAAFQLLARERRVRIGFCERLLMVDCRYLKGPAGVDYGYPSPHATSAARVAEVVLLTGLPETLVYSCAEALQKRASRLARVKP